MPYLGREPQGILANTIEGNLKVTGIISADSINDKLALNGSDTSSPQSNANDQIVLEAGTLDDSTHTSVVPAMAATDILLLEDATGSQEFLPATEGGLRSVQVFESSGTYTKPSGLSFLKVTVVGGGGGGGGEAGSNSGGGGAGGGTAIKYIDAADVGSTETVTIGAGGADSATADASAGGTSSFGSHCSATGGSGGQTDANPDIAPPGGTGSGGDINIQGGSASMSSHNGANNDVRGGNSTHGFAGVKSYQDATSTGSGFGGGGAGIYYGVIGTSRVRDGTAGIVYVEEFK